MTAILMYHDIVDVTGREECGFPGAVAARYKLTPAQFESHLDALAAAAADVGTVSPSLTLPHVALTFDDGGASGMRAAEMLEQRGWRGHFFITTGRIGTPGFLDTGAVAELAARGHVVGSHSHRHPTYMGKLPAADIRREWEESRDALDAILGAPPLIASVPGGFFTPTVAREAQAAGFRILMTSNPVTRVSTGHGLTVLGRYTVWATTPASTARAYAAGDALPRARLWLEWKAKTAAKSVAPTVYERARRAWAMVRR